MPHHNKAVAPCLQDEMMLAAARRLADYVPKEKILEEGKIYPEACELRTVAATVRARRQIWAAKAACTVTLNMLDVATTALEG